MCVCGLMPDVPSSLCCERWESGSLGLCWEGVLSLLLFPCALLPAPGTPHRGPREGVCRGNHSGRTVVLTNCCWNTVFSQSCRGTGPCKHTMVQEASAVIASYCKPVAPHGISPCSSGKLFSGKLFLLNRGSLLSL